MWIFVFLAWTAILTCANGQYSSRQELLPQNHDHGNGWDIRLSVPGEPGTDYPTLGTIPRTSFSCAGKNPGYYADLETNCQVFRICTLGSTYGFQSFLCPNGTLFNQEVFVCDWWMNVNCVASEKYFNNNNEKYAKLKLGPHMMNDIKKMLTHPARNPYDKNNIRNNYVIMQQYKPPSGQLFPNAALISSQDRGSKNIVFPVKQVISPYNQNYNGVNDNIITASTPSPQYVPALFNNAQSYNQGSSQIQRQTKTGRYVQNNEIRNSQTESTFSNSHSARITQKENAAYSNDNKENTARQNFRRLNNQVNTQGTFTGQRNQQNSQYRQNTINSQTNDIKQTELGIAYKKEQFTYPSQQNSVKQQQFSNDITRPVSQVNEVKENLVSESYLPSTVITKTLTFDRLIKGSKQTNPSSRLTFKTWIIKPSKTARLISEPTSYKYNRPTTTAKLILEPTPYAYNKPPSSEFGKLISEPNSYVYNKPANSEAEKLIIQNESGYIYNNPSTSSRLISTTSEASQLYLVPTTFRPTAAAPIYQPPTTPKPTISARLYLAPTSVKPTIAARIYIPPTQSKIIFARQQFTPNALLQPVHYNDEDLQVSPTAPTPIYSPSNEQVLQKPSFTFTKQSHVNTNHNNLTFTDILTKEKLDITVNDIVKDTSNILGTTSTNQLGQLKQDIKNVDYPESHYLPPEESHPDNNIENILQVTHNNISKSGRVIQEPSTELEPPIETVNFINRNDNPLTSLPFYKESSIPTNTIERTVSLKISIPEKTAAYLFNSKNDSDFDKLEILNTGSSNYLVLTNNNFNKITQPNFIPIGKLIIDKYSNISNSQALVYSFLADSINVAKGYSNIVNEDLNLQKQFQNVNNQEYSQLSNKISELTSSHYGNNNAQQQITNANIMSTIPTSTSNYVHGNVKFSNDISQKQELQRLQNAQINQIHTKTYSGNSNIARLQNTGNQIYSGQLYQIPVPDVSSQIYNEQNEANFIALTNNNPIKDEDLQKTLNEKNHNSAEVEIVKSHSLPLPASPAKLQEAPLNPTKDDSHEEVHSDQQIFRNYINGGNGITAQVQDKIVGSITHPSEDKKIVTYKKDQSYYVYTKLDEHYRSGDSNKGINQFIGGTDERNGKLIQNNNAGNLVSFQLIPSIGYQVKDEKEQQKILNAFQVNDYGSSSGRNSDYQNENNVALVTSNVNYGINHPLTTQVANVAYRNPDKLYTGPSSYSAPQGSIGRLELQQQYPNQRKILNNNFTPERLKETIEEDGYPRETPTPQFSF